MGKTGLGFGSSYIFFLCKYFFYIQCLFNKTVTLHGCTHMLAHVHVNLFA